MPKTVRPEVRSGRFTIDDKYLFVNIREIADYEDVYYIARINVGDHTLTYIKQ